MRKLLISLLAVSSVSAFAMRNNLFQEFDNQVSIGFGMNQTNSSFGTNPAVSGAKGVTQTNIVNLEAERLFDKGVWVDLNATMAFGAGPQGNALTGNTGPFAGKPYANPTDYGLNAKVGYAFTMAGLQHLQITPYGLVGLNNTSSNLGLSTNPQVANNFVYTGGLGGRIEYRINRAIFLYADQLAAYNWDQSGPGFGIMPQNTMVYTSTLGAKFNVVKNFQIGVKGFYNNFQPQASNSTAGLGLLNTAGGYLAQPQNSFGGLVSVGLTY